LASTLEQKPERLGFSLPSLPHMLNLVAVIDRKNWLLTFKIISCIQPKHINANKFDEQYMLIRALRSLINSICKLALEYYGKHPEEERYAVPNNPELTVIFSHFPLLIKFTKIILLNTFVEKERGSKHLSLMKEKLYLLERLFLFHPFMNEEVAGSLTKLANSNK
jgi:hypothetical protein